MYRELNDASRQLDRRERIRPGLPRSRRDRDAAHARRRLARRPRSERNGATVVPVPIDAGTVAFGTVEADLDLPYADGGIAWDPSLVFPGLRTRRAPGEPDRPGAAGADPRRRRDRARRRPGRSPRTPAGQRHDRRHRRNRHGRRRRPAGARPPRLPAGTPVGISGLEQAFNARLAGKPGGTLLAVAEDGGSARIIAKAKPQPGAPVKTTIDPDLQEAAVSALAGRAGGVAVLDARNGDVRALAGQAFSAPQPPGSTFKMITTTAALEKGVVSLDDEFEITDGANVGGRFISNANGEFCGGTFREAFAESCNADFAPLGPKIGNDDFVAAAERFGFNSPPTLYAPGSSRSRTGRIDDPDRDRRRSRPRGDRDRPGRSPGDAAGDGEHRPDDRQRRRPRADLARRQQEAAPGHRSRCG